MGTNTGKKPEQMNTTEEERELMAAKAAMYEQVDKLQLTPLDALIAKENYLAMGAGDHDLIVAAEAHQCWVRHARIRISKGGRIQADRRHYAAMRFTDKQVQKSDLNTKVVNV